MSSGLLATSVDLPISVGAIDRFCGLVVRVRFLALPDFLEAVGLERGALSIMSTIEELIGRNSSGSSLETENMAEGIRCTDHDTVVRKSWH
jgi:hypothetical protein